MAESTNIEWCDSTFNPWIGCTRVSPGCDNCYAARQDAHRRWTPEGWGGPRQRTSAALWKGPVKWNGRPFFECGDCRHRGEGADAGSGAVVCDHCHSGRLVEARRRVFCASLADVFDNQVPVAWRIDLLRLIEQTPHLDWLLLTKRIGNVERLLDEAADLMPEVLRWPLPNVWLGATVVDQQEADRDIPKLLAVPARVRFLSIEPMLGPIDLRCIDVDGDHEIHPLTGTTECVDGEGNLAADIDWVICGGESGPGARPMHPDWARSLRDQCAATGVPFMFKQWGEWAPGQAHAKRKLGSWMTASGHIQPWAGGAPRDKTEIWTLLYDVGKKIAGRLLDGMEHIGFPESK